MAIEIAMVAAPQPRRFAEEFLICESNVGKIQQKTAGGTENTRPQRIAAAVVLVLTTIRARIGLTPKKWT